MKKLIAILCVVIGILMLASCDLSKDVEEAENAVVEGGVGALGGYIKKAE